MVFNKKEWAYIFYDWAESCFTVIVASFIFPMLWGLLSKGVAGSESLYGLIVSGISLTIAILSPVLGTVADYHGYKKRFFLFFFILGILCTAAISLYPTDSELWWVVLIPYVLASVGYAGTNVFYDSFIVDVTNDERMDKVSTAGYAFGYIGGSTIPLILAIILLQIIPSITIEGYLHLGPLAIPYDIHSGFRITFLMTSLWWLFFSIPFLRNVRQVHGIAPERNPLANSFKRLWHTLRNIRQWRSIVLFLIAFFLYIDGVHTVISMAVPFATNAIDAVNPDNATAILLPILLAIQVAAFFFALLFSWLSNHFKTSQLLYTTIAIYCLVSLIALFVREIWHFWILGLLVATSQGAIQSLSRSWFGKIIPKHMANEFFGFYTIFGRFAAVLGPTLVGGISYLVWRITGDISGGTMRYGVSSLLVLFVGGAFFFTLSLLANRPNTVGTPPSSAVNERDGGNA